MVTCTCPGQRGIAQVDERLIAKSLIEPEELACGRYTGHEEFENKKLPVP